MVTLSLSYWLKTNESKFVLFEVLMVHAVSPFVPLTVTESRLEPHNTHKHRGTCTCSHRQTQTWLNSAQGPHARPLCSGVISQFQIFGFSDRLESESQHLTEQTCRFVPTPFKRFLSSHSEKRCPCEGGLQV